MNQRPSAYCEFGSDGWTLRFPEADMYREFKCALDDVRLTYYGELRKKYGIWASNQACFVATPEDLKPQDSRLMEERYERWLRRQA